MTPNNISVGERNIIALCYFFTELIMNQEAKDGYSKKIVLVIDDLISSFDFENKVGIMSLLKIKVSYIIMTNPESQILIMTHDIQCLYDLQKIADEVKATNNGQKKRLYLCRELKNKKLIPFSYKKRNEYSELLKNVYDYACGESEGEEFMEERTNSLTDMDYLDFLSEEERQRTAREVICFIYLLNDYHVLAHLDGKKNIIFRNGVQI